MEQYILFGVTTFMLFAGIYYIKNSKSSSDEDLKKSLKQANIDGQEACGTWLPVDD